MPFYHLERNYQEEPERIKLVLIGLERDALVTAIVHLTSNRLNNKQDQIYSAPDRYILLCPWDTSDRKRIQLNCMLIQQEHKQGKHHDPIQQKQMESLHEEFYYCMYFKGLHVAYSTMLKYLSFLFYDGGCFPPMFHLLSPSLDKDFVVSFVFYPNSFHIY